GGAAMPGAMGAEKDAHGSAGEESHPPERPADYSASFPFPGVRKTVSWAESRAAYAVQAPGSAPTEAGGGIAKDLFGETASSSISLEEFRKAQFQPMLQLDRTYLLTRRDHEVYIFDQHAAAERSLYEKLLEAAQNNSPHRQALLLPWVWETSGSAAAVIQDHLADLAKLGYDLESFGGQSFRIKAVPGVLGDSPKVRALLEGLVEDLLTEAIPRRWDAILTRAACRGSVKAGDPLSGSEMEKIVKDLQRCQSPWSCPHGRPTFLRLSPEELAKRFKRT
ncbi:MAG: hypothetical protein HY548_02875, partial [Elusimicrobia bacterium]|nr:hypothetical protein [Elusimicrobiota bacterium]